MVILKVIVFSYIQVAIQALVLCLSHSPLGVAHAVHILRLSHTAPVRMCHINFIKSIFVLHT